MGHISKAIDIGGEYACMRDYMIAAVLRRATFVVLPCDKCMCLFCQTAVKINSNKYIDTDNGRFYFHFSCIHTRAISIVSEHSERGNQVHRLARTHNHNPSILCRTHTIARCRPSSEFTIYIHVHFFIMYKMKKKKHIFSSSA